MYSKSSSDSPEDLPASLVLTPLDGALGSPVPIALLATTLNSYSTQGLSSTAMADSMSPVTGSGSAHKSVVNQDKRRIRAPALLYRLWGDFKTHTSLRTTVQLYGCLGVYRSILSEECRTQSPLNTKSLKRTMLNVLTKQSASPNSSYQFDMWLQREYIVITMFNWHNIT